MRKLLNVGYFRLARNVSKYSNHRVKVGAVICKKKPISCASNTCKTHPIHADPSNSIRGAVHAEVRAVINAGTDELENATVYVYRETRDGKPALARPCNYCYNFLKLRGVKKIFYTVVEFPYWKVERL